MMPEESIVDAINRLEAAINRLEMLLKGDQYTQMPGLVADVRRLQEQVVQMQSVRLSAWQWLFGFTLFVGGVAMSNHAACGMFGIPTGAGLTFAILLWAISAVFFLSGLGLIRWK
jgi:hypothetical protein